MELNCFKAYDIRGQVPQDLDEDLAYKIGRAFVDEIGANTVVVGFDVRLESPIIAGALIRGITEAGADVIDIGLCGTEEVYFNTFHRSVDGGIMVTASHNPKGFNGMKLVREQSKPISGDTGLFAIRDRISSDNYTPKAEPPGKVIQLHDKSDYVAHLLSYVDRQALKPLRIVANPGNGGAGQVMHLLEKFLPFEIIHINDAPDGDFPNGVPNPLLPENRAATVAAVKANHADLGLAWDGDFDRCFFFDADGRFIEGYYLVGLLAEVVLAKHPGAKIIHDPRLTWNTIDQVEQAGGQPIQSKTGHAFIKERMRLEDAEYGGEMSAHHYFKDFAYCDTGMIPWLLIAELMSKTGKSLASLVDERMRAFPCSGEINFKVKNVGESIEKVVSHFVGMRPHMDYTDGVSVEFESWRFNLRGSNTEPLLRLNIETREDPKMVQEKLTLIEALIEVQY